MKQLQEKEKLDTVNQPSEAAIDMLPGVLLDEIFKYCYNELTTIPLVKKSWNKRFQYHHDKQTNSLYHLREGLLSPEKIYAQNGAIFVVRKIKGLPFLFVQGNDFRNGFGTHFKLADNALNLYLLPKGINSIKNIAIGENHALILGSDDKKRLQIWGIERSWSRVLGQGDKDMPEELVQLKIPQSLKQIENVAAGKQQSIIWGRNDKHQIEIFATGSNTFGQLGTGNRDVQNLFTEVKVPLALKKISGVHVAPFYTMMWGINQNGQPKLWGSGLSRLFPFEDPNTNTFRQAKIPANIKEIKQVFSINKEYKSYNVICGIDQEDKQHIWVHDSQTDDKENPFTLAKLPDALAIIDGTCVNGADLFVWGRDAEDHCQLFRTRMIEKTTQENGQSQWTICNLPKNLQAIESVAVQEEVVCIQGMYQDGQRAIYLSSVLEANCGHWTSLTTPVLNTKILAANNGVLQEAKEAYLKIAAYVHAQSQKKRWVHKKSNATILKEIEQCLALAADKKLTLEALEALKQNIVRLVRHRRIKENAVVVVAALTGMLLGAVVSGLLISLVLMPLTSLPLGLLIVASVTLTLALAFMFGIPADRVAKPAGSCTTSLSRYTGAFFNEIKPTEEVPLLEDLEKTDENTKIKI